MRDRAGDGVSGDGRRVLPGDCVRGEFKNGWECLRGGNAEFWSGSVEEEVLKLFLVRFGGW